jgi:hypothetical protein
MGEARLGGAWERARIGGAWRRVRLAVGEGPAAWGRVHMGAPLCPKAPALRYNAL